AVACVTVPYSLSLHDALPILREQLPQARLIAEDLGTITPDVEQLRDRFGFPGMKVLQFAFSPQEQSSYLPHNCPKRAVIYTGTRSEEHTSELQSRFDLVCRLL